MHKLLDQYLCTKYPKLFVNRKKGKMESCMFWGFECGDGWFSLIDGLCAQIQHEIDNPPQVRRYSIVPEWIGRPWNEYIYAYIIQPLIDELRPRGPARFAPWGEPWSPPRNWALRLWLERNLQWQEYRYVEGPKINQVVVIQVKEKFGGLRFYCDFVSTERIEALISFAESLSYTICEISGRMDLTIGYTTGWIRTVSKDVMLTHTLAGGGDGWTERDPELTAIFNQIELEKALKTSIK